MQTANAARHNSDDFFNSEKHLDIKVTRKPGDEVDEILRGLMHEVRQEQYQVSRGFVEFHYYRQYR